MPYYFFILSTIDNIFAVQIVVMNRSLFIVYLIVISCFSTVTGRAQITSVSPNDTICTGMTVTFTGATTSGADSITYQWLLNGLPTGITSAAYSGSSFADGDMIKAIITTYTGSASTVTEDSVRLAVLAHPDPGTLSGATSVCVGSSVTLTPTVSGGTWSATNTRASVTGGVVTGVSNGRDTILYYVENAGCGNYTAHEIQVGPYAGSISGATSVCVGSSITLTGIGGGVWASSNATASITGTGLVTGLEAGIDTISYIVFGSCGAGVATHIITINPLPDAGTITGTATVCVGATTTLSSTGGSGSWSATNSNATVAAGVVTGVAAGLDTIVYIVTNSCGADTALRTVTINPLPVAGTISGDAVLCAGRADTFTATVAGGTWSAVNTHAAVTSGGIVTGTTAGVDTILYTITNTCGSATAMHIITINPLPVAGTISGVSVLCLGDTSMLTCTATGGTWSASNTHVLLTDSMAVASTVGLDTISYTVINGCGTAVATHIISAATAPVLGAISGPAAVCAGSTITLTATISGGTWTLSNGNATNVAGAMTGVSYGRDTVTYIYTNTCGSDTAVRSFAIDTAAPVVSGIAGAATVCVGATTTFTDSAAGGVWSVTNTRATITSAGVATGITAGLDTVVYTITNGCGTADTFRQIAVLPLPFAGILTGYDSVCRGSSIVLTSSASGGTWLSDNPDFVTVDASGNVYGALNGNANIMYIVTNSCGADTVIKNVRVNVPVFPIIGVSSVCQGESTVLLNPSPGGSWSSDNFLVAPVLTGFVFGLTPGFAIISYTLRNACGTTVAEHEMEVIDCTLDIAPTAAQSSVLEVYPNPSQGTFTVSLPAGSTEKATVTVTNVLGQVVAEYTLPTNKATELHLAAPAGIYHVTATIAGNKLSTRLILEN